MTLPMAGSSLIASLSHPVAAQAWTQRPVCWRREAGVPTPEGASPTQDTFQALISRLHAGWGTEAEPP